VTAKLLTAKAEAISAFSRALFATSLLAAAPQLSRSIGASNCDKIRELECSAKDYNTWWTGVISSSDAQVNLNGHSLAVSESLAPLLSMRVPDGASPSAEGTRVDMVCGKFARRNDFIVIIHGHADLRNITSSQCRQNLAKFFLVVPKIGQKKSSVFPNPWR
jgi:hypothetical protein